MMRLAFQRLILPLIALAFATLPALAQADRCPKLVAQFPGFPSSASLVDRKSVV